MIDARMILFVLAAACARPPPTVTLSHASGASSKPLPSAPDGSDIIGKHAIGEGIAAPVFVRPDKDHASGVVEVTSDAPQIIEVARTSNEALFVFVGHTLGHATITVRVDRTIATTFGADVVPQP